jgi:tetratricopeptide (TPR) repeat protein
MNSTHSVDPEKQKISEEQLLSAINESPSEPSSFENLAKEFIANERSALPLDIAKRAAEQYPNSADTLYFYGKSLEASNNSSESIKAYSKALRIQIDHKHASRALNLILIGQSNAQSVQTASFYALSKALDTQRDHLQSLQLRLRMLEGNIDKKNSLLSVGLAYLELKQFKLANDYFLELLDIDPNSIEALNELAFSEIKHGSLDSAKQYIERSLSISPENQRALTYKAFILFAEQKNEACYSILYKMYSQFKNSELNIFLLIYFFIGGMYSNKLLYDATSFDKNNERLHELFRFLIELIARQDINLILKFKQVFDVDVQQYESVLQLLGKSALNAGNINLAEACFKEIKHILPNSPIASNGISLLHLQKNNLEAFKKSAGNTIQSMLNIKMTALYPELSATSSRSQNYGALAQAKFPDEDIGSILSYLHSHSKFQSYLEIVNWDQDIGNSLAKTNTTTISISHQTLKISTSNRYFFKAHPNLFFNKVNLSDIIQSKLGMIYIASDNDLPQFLIALIYLSDYITPKTIICVKNTYPLDGITSSERKYTSFWTGNIWKLVPVLKEFFPSINIKTLKAFPAGVSIMNNFDATAGKILRCNFPEIINYADSLHYDDFYYRQDEVLNAKDSKHNELLEFLSI